MLLDILMGSKPLVKFAKCWNEKGKEGPTANFRAHTMLKKPKPRASLCLAVHGLPWRLVAARPSKETVTFWRPSCNFKWRKLMVITVIPDDQTC